MYQPTQQLQNHARFILGYTAATLTAVSLSYGAGYLDAVNHDNLSNLAVVGSIIPYSIIAYLTFTQRTIPTTTDEDFFGTGTDESDVIDELEQLWLRPTRRGGSATEGRENQPASSDVEANARALLGEEKYTELAAPVSVWRRLKNAVDFLIGSDDPKTLIGSWAIVGLIAVAVFA